LILASAVFVFAASLVMFIGSSSLLAVSDASSNLMSHDDISSSESEPRDKSSEETSETDSESQSGEEATDTDDSSGDESDDISELDGGDGFSEDVDTADSSVVDVSEFGNDENAIQNAIDQATEEVGEGATVYFPAGTYTISRDTGPRIEIDSPPDNLRLIGDGQETELRYSNENQNDNNHWMLTVSGGAEGFEMHNMVVNGNKEGFNEDPNTNTLIRIREGEPGSQSYLFNNLILEENSGTGITTRTHGVKITNCAVRNNGGHGINIGTHHDDPYNSENRERIKVRNCYVHGNGRDKGGHYGIDHAYGDFEIVDTVIEDNEQGAKTSSVGSWHDHSDWAPNGIHKRTRIINNDINPYQSTNANEDGILRFEDVVVGPGNGESMRLTQHEYVLDNVILHQGYRLGGDRVTEKDVKIGEGDLENVPNADEVGAFLQ